MQQAGAVEAGVDRDSSKIARLRDIIEHAAHFLPDQGPIGVFIHHNTLHAFQHLPFHQAVLEGHALFGGEPYLSETEFRKAYARGRITDDDLDAALDKLEQDDGVLIRGFLSLRELRKILLLREVEVASPEIVEWNLEEKDCATRLRRDVPPRMARRLVRAGARWLAGILERGDLEDFSEAVIGSRDLAEARALFARRFGARFERQALRTFLRHDPEAMVTSALWSACLAITPRSHSLVPPPLPKRERRHRDVLLELTREDIDQPVNEALIRWTAAYLDFGIAYWPMSSRQHGFYRAVRHLVLSAGAGPSPWFDTLRAEFAVQEAAGASALGTILGALHDLGVPEEDYEGYLGSTLQALPGWAGMMSRLERRPSDRAAHAPPASLADFLAVRLTLERSALRYAASNVPNFSGRLADLSPRKHPLQLYRKRTALVRAHTIFQSMQFAGVPPYRIRRLEFADAETLLAEIRHFHELARRRVWQEAYERQHRREILDALAEHRRKGFVRSDVSARYQVFFCFDEREESIRRHLEELGPEFETFGTAGFFGVAMDYRGIDDVRHVPLCPVVVTPAHEIEEAPIGEHADLHRLRQYRRRLWAKLAHTLRVGSRSLVRGSVLTAGLGLSAVVPLTLRILFPRLWAKVRNRTRDVFLPRPRTELASLRSQEDTSPRGRHRGFTTEEQVQRVAATFEAAGLVGGFAPLVAIFGHGSTSFNNPLRSAYDCGACGGNRGEPNARLFAKLANLPEVRAGLRERGIHIPDSTFFVGGIHDTCNDAILFCDTDGIPETHREAFMKLRSSLDHARMMNAHERCRRFETIPKNVAPRSALEHVEIRSEHLGEPRPEYGHCTNAVCIVGRRTMTRGLFLDRRAFLISYDATIDPEGKVVERILAAAAPVGAGITLEYYFSSVDNQIYGCGTKIPHNVAGLLGVMNGPASDLRTGLAKQMIEIHEPVRLLLIVEARPEVLLSIAKRQAEVRELVVNRWVQLVCVDPETGAMQVFEDHGFVDYEPALKPLPTLSSSIEWYRGKSQHLTPARIERPCSAESEAPSRPQHANAA